MKKNNVVQRPTSFNQPFLNTHRTKVARQNCSLVFSNESEYPLIGSNFPMEDNKILKTPTTPQFPMPDSHKPFINEILQGEFETHQLDKRSFDQGSEDFPWTPDTPSSDSKDPLMTDAVNIECSNVFFSKFVPNYTRDPTESYQSYSQLESIQYSINPSPVSPTFNQFQSQPTIQINQDTISEIKKTFCDLPFDISSFTFPSNTSMISSSNKKRPRLHLLQFIYCLLNSSRPTQCVCWVDKDECIFRIINPNKLTNLWGRYKQNPNMSFDSLSRSLRLYYASGRLERVTGQRNQYRFVNREESIDFNRRNKRKSQHFSLEGTSSKSLSGNMFGLSKTSVPVAFVSQAAAGDSKYYCSSSLPGHGLARPLV